MGYSRYKSRQDGFLLPLVLFLIVVSSGAALLMSRQIERSALLTVDIILYEKSLYAAEIGAQLGMHHLLFGKESDLEQINPYEQCKTLNRHQRFQVVEFKNCEVQTSCSSQPISKGQRHYIIESEASCTSVNSVNNRLFSDAPVTKEAQAIKDNPIKTATQKIRLSQVL